MGDLSSDEKKGYISRNYENVISVELTQFVMKDTRTQTNASDNPKIPPYILLEIEEFSSICEGDSNYMNNSFARLIYYDLLDDGTENISILLILYQKKYLNLKNT